jgi:hypothetical protein
MYDVTNVFAVVGCCEKTSGDLLRWIGLSQIPFRLRQLQLDVGADTAQATLDDIIGSSDMVSISALTMRFLLCFLVLRLKTMDIRQISRYLARRTGRRKSTLCKLYQVAHILEAAAICGRTETPGMVSLVDQFFAPVEITDLPQGPGNPYAIDALLNHPRPPDDTVIAKRRADFFAEVARPLFEPEEDDDD